MIFIVPVILVAFTIMIDITPTLIMTLSSQPSYFYRCICYCLLSVACCLLSQELSHGGVVTTPLLTFAGKQTQYCCHYYYFCWFTLLTHLINTPFNPPFVAHSRRSGRSIHRCVACISGQFILCHLFYSHYFTLLIHPPNTLLTHPSNTPFNPPFVT